MEYLVFWVGTCLMSIGMDIVVFLRIAKDVADYGYRIDGEIIEQILSELTDKNNELITFIPTLNVMTSYEKAVKYNESKGFIIERLNALKILEEMTSEEKKEYQKKPTGLNAIKISMKYEKRLKRASLLQICDVNEESVIYYEIDESLNDITILKVVGFASRLTTKEQKQLILNAIANIIKLEMLQNEENIEKEYKEEQEDLIPDEKQVLEDLKNMLLEEPKKQKSKTRTRK